MKPGLGKTFLPTGTQERCGHVVTLETATRDAARRRKIVRIGSVLRNGIGRSAPILKDEPGHW